MVSEEAARSTEPSIKERSRSYESRLKQKVSLIDDGELGSYESVCRLMYLGSTFRSALTMNQLFAGEEFARKKVIYLMVDTRGKSFVQVKFITSLLI